MDDTMARDEDGAGLDDVADRLEAALDRIVRQLESTGTAAPDPAIAARLDGLIRRLREALGPDGTAGG